MAVKTIQGISILGKVDAQYTSILTPEAQKFLAILHRSFNSRRLSLLKKREDRYHEFEAGKLPEFLTETKWIREDPTWRGAKPAPGLTDRRVEITGPVERKMLINALNSGSSTFMADLEDSNAPTWSNCLAGQANLRDAVRKTITFVAPNGKYYYLKGPKIPTLLVRPRGWHMEEKHFLVDGKPISASLFDFGLYFFHNAKETVRQGFGPYFYLPKMESHLEARLWNDVFNLAQDSLEVPRGTIRATVLIETILAAYEMDEIIYELREHSSGLNCGRWDYIFSFIKKFRDNKEFVLPDRSEVTMTVPFMDAYVRLLIKTCHKRGVHAMGGMAAQIPIKNDPKANETAMTKVRRDKEREVLAGHDGTWVAHPDLVKIAKDIFDKYMPQANQLYVLREEVEVTAADLISLKGVSRTVTEKGVYTNIDVALQYMEAWLRGNGCVPIHNLMEDAATAEISRSQLWQWVRHKVVTDTGKTVDPVFVTKALQETIATYKTKLGPKFNNFKYEEAGKLLAGTIQGQDYSDFLTTLCYDKIVSYESQAKL